MFYTWFSTVIIMLEVNNLYNECQLRVVAHRLTADQYVKYSACLQIPILLFAAMIASSASIFAAMKMTSNWAQIITAFLGLLIGIFSGVSQWLNYGANAIKHQNKSRAFERLVLGIKKLSLEKNDDILKAKYTKISDIAESILCEEGYPRLPLRYETQARKYILDTSMVISIV